jgi:hypothetical protein
MWPSLMLSVCALACAQGITGDRVVVPARNTSHPRVVNANVLNGSITVKASSGNEVIVETGGARTNRALAGMTRIDLPRGLDVEEEDNVITVRTHPGGSAHLAITVPTDTSLNLKSLNGSITVEGVHGEIDANSHNGQVTLADVSGTVVANTFNGALKVAMDRVDPAKPMSFSTFNGCMMAGTSEGKGGPSHGTYETQFSDNGAGDAHRRVAGSLRGPRCPGPRRDEDHRYQDHKAEPKEQG